MSADRAERRRSDDHRRQWYELLTSRSNDQLRKTQQVTKPPDHRRASAGRRGAYQTAAAMAADPLQAQKEAAAKALVADAGCVPDRARALVDAFAEVVAQEALAVIAGTAEVPTGVIDARVARLRRLVDALPEEERFPDAYELGAIFKITESQARSVIRTYQARYPSAYRGRVEAAVKSATAEAKTIGAPRRLGDRVRRPGRARLLL